MTLCEIRWWLKKVFRTNPIPPLHWRNFLCPRMVLMRERAPLKYFYWPFQGGTSFVDHLWFCVLCFLCFRVHSLLPSRWSPAWKGLTSWFLLVMFIVFLLLSHVVSWVRCGTWLYRFLIFAVFLTSIIVHALLSSRDLKPKLDSSSPLHVPSTNCLLITRVDQSSSLPERFRLRSSAL